MAVARWLETDTYSNKDISSAVSIGVYTADADRFVLPQLLIDQAAGNGDYVYYVTLQVNGAGSSYVFGPKTTSAAASGETAIGAQGGAIFVRSGDVLTVYVDGLAGDNSTPDTIVRWAEMATLKPATADRTLAADANGYVIASNALDAAGTRSALGMAAADLDTQLDAIQAQTDTIDDIKAVTDALDISAVTQVAASSAGHLTITVARTFDEAVTGLTIPADWVTALWTLKTNPRDADTAALVQLRETNPAAGGDGLQRLNGAALVAPITAADGALTVTQASGRIDVWLSDEMTALLGAATAIGWDVKFIDASGDSTGQRGTADVVLTETKSTA